MDEILDVADVVADSELEGAFTWLLRVLGVLAILAGIGNWVLTDVSLFVPVVLILVGIVLVAIPSILLEVAEVAG